MFEHGGFIVEGNEGDGLGVLMFKTEDKECEILSIDSFKEGHGIGTALLNELKKKCQSRGISTLWLITSNDNTYAMKFYQKRGFDMVAVRRNAIIESRKLKPSIPLVGTDEIEIKHEVEFEIKMGV